MTQEEKEILIAKYLRGVKEETWYGDFIKFPIDILGNHEYGIRQLKFTKSLDWINLALDKIVKENNCVLRTFYSPTTSYPHCCYSETGEIELSYSGKSEIEAKVNYVVAYITRKNEQKK